VASFLTEIKMKQNDTTLIQITQNGMGHGDETLGLKLIGNYLKLIVQENSLPKFIVFYNSGVQLICEGSPAIDILREIENKGVKLIACKTCLDYYQLSEKVEVGHAGTMVDIIALQNLAGKVINL